MSSTKFKLNSNQKSITDILDTKLLRSLERRAANRLNKYRYRIQQTHSFHDKNHKDATGKCECASKIWMADKQVAFWEWRIGLIRDLLVERMLLETDQ